MGKFRDLTGQRFGRWTVIGRALKKGKRSCWLCKCACGTERIIIEQNLLNGSSKSCGCFHSEAVTKSNSQKTTHRLTNDPIYDIWATIKQRCFNPKNKEYKNYGARGITLYPDWVHDFKAFYDYVSKLPHCREEGYSLDRIDNDKNYEPGNLRFATKAEQCRNQRRNVVVEYHGEEMTLAEASERSGISYLTLFSRYQQGDRSEKLFRKPHEGRGKLTTAERQYIIANYIPRDPEFGQGALARKFSVMQSTIHGVLERAGVI